MAPVKPPTSFTALASLDNDDIMRRVAAQEKRILDLKAEVIAQYERFLDVKAKLATLDQSVLDRKELVADDQGVLDLRPGWPS